MRWAAQAGSEIGDLNCVCNQDTVAAVNELHAMVHRLGLRFTVFYSSGLAGCAKLSAGAGVSTRLESK